MREWVKGEGRGKSTSWVEADEVVLRADDLAEVRRALEHELHAGAAGPITTTGVGFSLQILEAVIAAVVGAVLAVGGLLVGKSVFLDRILDEAYRANLIERITTSDILLMAPVLVVAGAVVSALTAWATLRLVVKD